MAKLDGRSTRYVRERGGTITMLQDHEKRIEKLERRLKHGIS